MITTQFRPITEPGFAKMLSKGSRRFGGNGASGLPEPGKETGTPPRPPLADTIDFVPQRPDPAASAEINMQPDDDFDWPSLDLDLGFSDVQVSYPHRLDTPNNSVNATPGGMDVKTPQGNNAETGPYIPVKDVSLDDTDAFMAKLRHDIALKAKERKGDYSHLPPPKTWKELQQRPGGQMNYWLTHKEHGPRLVAQAPNPALYQSYLKEPTSPEPTNSSSGLSGMASSVIATVRRRPMSFAAGGSVLTAAVVFLVSGIASLHSRANTGPQENVVAAAVPNPGKAYLPPPEVDDIRPFGNDREVSVVEPIPEEPTPPPMPGVLEKQVPRAKELIASLQKSSGMNQDDLVQELSEVINRLVPEADDDVTIREATAFLHGKYPNLKSETSLGLTVQQKMEHPSQLYTVAFSKGQPQVVHIPEGKGPARVVVTGTSENAVIHVPDRVGSQVQIENFSGKLTVKLNTKVGIVEYNAGIQPGTQLNIDSPHIAVLVIPPRAPNVTVNLNGGERSYIVAPPGDIKLDMTGAADGPRKYVITSDNRPDRVTTVNSPANGNLVKPAEIRTADQNLEAILARVSFRTKVQRLLELITEERRSVALANQQEAPVRPLVTVTVLTAKTDPQGMPK
jgi:hypothetical protein